MTDRACRLGWTRIVKLDVYVKRWDAIAAAHEAYQHRSNALMALFCECNTDATEMIEGWYWRLWFNNETLETAKKLRRHSPPWLWAEAQIDGMTR